MKLFIFLSLVILLGLIVVWLMGPRYIITKAPDSVPSLPQDLNHYLSEQERIIPELKEGTQKEILWAHEDKRKTEYAFVYLHGFSSSRAEVSPLLENVASELNANLFFTRFSGHGSRSGELMKQADRDDWMEDTLEACAIGSRIGDKWILVGTSHGGLLAGWAAALEKPEAPHALVMISPNFAPSDSRTRLLTLPWARQLLPLVFGTHRQWEPQNSGHNYYWNTRYPSHALFPMMAQVDYITPEFPDRIHIPTLVFYSNADQTVRADLIQTVFQRLPAKTKHLVEVSNSGDKNQHILAGDILSPNTTGFLEKEILAFLSEVPQ